MILRILAGLATGFLFFSLPVTAQTVSLVSVDSSGVQSNGDSRAPRISADGNWVVFKSDASNLVAGDSNGFGDVFVRDLASGATSLVSFAPGGAPANGESFSPHVNTAGSVIVFHSSATNLVAGDTNARDDVFALVSGVIVRAASVQPNNHSREPIVSGDGRYVVFESLASNLVPSDTNGTWDIFRYDLQTGTTVRVSVSGTGAQANGESHDAWVDGDGSVVCFASLATNLVTGDTNGSSDVFLRDVVGGQTIGATVAGNGGSDSPSISADGQWVAFRSSANNLVAGDLNGLGDVFFADPWNQQISRVSVGLNGLEANGASSLPQISPDGLFVVFQSAASNLFAADGNNRDDVFIHDIAKGLTWRQSGDAYNQDGNDDSFAPSVADGGMRVVFKSEAGNLAPGDGNGIGDIMLRAPAAMTWYVDGTLVNSGVGSPADPFNDLGAAISHPLTSSGDLLLLFPGTYIGGFDCGQKRISIHGTSGAANTVLTGLRAERVLTIRGDPNVPVQIQDLTITGGEPRFDGSRNNDGAGLYIDGGEVTVVRCNFAGNGQSPSCTTYRGGALAAFNASVTIDGCTFASNAASGGGLALYVESQSESVTINASHFLDNMSCGGKASTGAIDINTNGLIRFSSCVFERNGSGQASWLPATLGGAVHLQTLNHVEILDCAFIDNTAVLGGAVFIYMNSATIDATSFVGNRALDEAGALFAAAGDQSIGLQITSSHFETNTSFGDAWGGGSIASWGGPLYISDTFIADSSSQLGGAILRDEYAGAAPVQLSRVVLCKNSSFGNIYCNCAASVAYGNFAFDRCTVVGNLTTLEGGSEGLLFGSCTISNSIVRNNVNADGSVAGCVGSLSVEWTNLDMPSTGPGLINADAMFWDPSAEDFHLLPGSPCIDAGDPLSPPDPDGSRADMGAFPFDPAYCGTPRAYCTAKTTSNGCTPSIAWTGSPHLSGGADDFFITASNVINNKNGLLFWGTDDAAIPFQGGYLCVKPPIVRTGLKNSEGNPPPNDCSGSFSHHFSQAYMQAGLMQPGTVVHAQYWFRDPGFQPPNNVGLSDALRFVICQ